MQNVIRHFLAAYVLFQINGGSFLRNTNKKHEIKHTQQEKKKSFKKWWRVFYYYAKQLDSNEDFSFENVQDQVACTRI